MKTLTDAKLMLADFLLSNPGFQHDRVALVGSVACLDQGNDVDVLFLVEHLDDAIKHLEAAQFKGLDNPQYPIDKWTSMKREDLNVLLTDDPLFFHGFVVSTAVCKALRLTSRDDRVKVHDIVRDNELET